MCSEQRLGGGVHRIEIKNRVAAEPGILRGERILHAVYVIDVFAAFSVKPGVEVGRDFFYRRNCHRGRQYGI